MKKNLAGKAFGVQGGPANGERSAGKMTYEKAKMEIIYFSNDDVFGASFTPSAGYNVTDPTSPASPFT